MSKVDRTHETKVTIGDLDNIFSIEYCHGPGFACGISIPRGSMTRYCGGENQTFLGFFSPEQVQQIVVELQRYLNGYYDK